jgi:hypothetical protein
MWIIEMTAASKGKETGQINSTMHMISGITIIPDKYRDMQPPDNPADDWEYCRIRPLIIPHREKRNYQRIFQR